LHQAGVCLSGTGKFAEAQPWFERAIAAIEKGDVHGRIDHASLDLTLRAGAQCLRALGKLDQAEQWEKRASSLKP